MPTTTKSYSARRRSVRRPQSLSWSPKSSIQTQLSKGTVAAGEDPNGWCRKVALIQLTEGFALTKNDRLLYEEIARVRYLVGHGFRLTLGLSEATAANWKKITADADQSTEIIADDLLSRRK